MTAPRATTASTRPDAAIPRATSGSSKAPGTHDTTTAPRSQPADSSSSSAADSIRSVMAPLNSAQAKPTRNSRATPGARSVGSRELPTRAAARALASSGSTVWSEDVIEALEEVTHALALGAEVLDVLRGGHRLDVHPLDDVEPEALETSVLCGIVGHEPHGGHAQVDQDLGTDAVLARVGRKAQLEVGIDGVEALLLEVVGAQLVGEADAPSLMAPQVHEHAAPVLVDGRHGPV